MKTILVTGAAGFIGSQLVDALLDGGCHVVGVDNFEVSYDPAIKLANLAGAQANPDFRLCEADVRDAEAMRSIVSKIRPAAAIHLAARVGARSGLQDPDGTRDVNVNGTRNVVVACGQVGTGVVVASSASVYGSGTESGCREDARLVQSPNPYVDSKQAAETVALEEASKHGIGAVVVRIASTYGPRQRPGTGLDTFAAQLLRGETVSLFADTATARDILFVDDVVRALILAAGRTDESDTMNIGSGRAVPMKDVVRLLAGTLGVKADVELVPAPVGYEEIGVMDVERARRIWDFEPRVSLETGLARYAQWYAARIGGGSR